MDNVSTFLWFESQAEAAATLYCSILSDAKITSSSKMSTSFTIGDQRYIAFNGGPHHKLSPAVSVFVSCANQAEVDALWDKFLASGGSEGRCGWLVDKFGLSWQIIPIQLMELLTDKDPVVAKRVLAAMMTMTKIDVAALVAAHRG